MPWTNQPGGSGSGNNGGGRGPWGQPGPQGGGNNNGNGQGGRGAADLEELLRSGRERFGRGGRGGGNGGSGGGQGDVKMPPRQVFIIAAVIAAVMYVFSCFYQVPPGARGVVTTFGAYTGLTEPGLNFRFTPFQDAEVVQVDEDRNISIRNGRTSMLTSDLNIVDVGMTVNYRVKPDGVMEPGDLPNAAKFFFNIEGYAAGHETLVQSVAESALRQVVGANDFERIISRGRSIVNVQTEIILQEVLDSYDSGIEVIRVNFGQADPPQEVIAAQRDVIDARSEAEKLVNEANRYKNSTVPRAAGQARQIELNAEAYAQRMVREANGQARRFKDIYTEYLQAPEVTRRRMYLENMEEVLGKMNKVVVDNGIGGSAVPYLNLNELSRRPTNRTVGAQ